MEWPEARELWDLEPGIAHLNNGSFGAVPRPVLAEQHRLHRRAEANPNRFFVRELGLLAWVARENAAAFLGADPGCFVFVENATSGTATVLASLDLEPGDEILLTDHNYNAVFVAARMMCERAGAKVVRVPIGLDAPVEAMLDAVTPRTKLAVIDHVSSPAGTLFPVAELVAAFRERGVLCHIDGAHAPGMLDVDLGAIDPDFWVGNFHKWAGAPRGAGGLYVRRELRDRITPIVKSHRSEDPFPMSYVWVGTRDDTPYLCVPKAIELFEGLGWERVRNYNATLADHGQSVIAKALDVPVLGGSAGVPMRLIELPARMITNMDEATALQTRIAEEAKAEIAVTTLGSRAFIRISAQVYNSSDEYEQLAETLPGIIHA